jgi:hypothetical protein
MGSKCAAAETAHNPSDCEAEAERSKRDGEREYGGRPGDRKNVHAGLLTYRFRAASKRQQRGMRGRGAMA